MRNSRLHHRITCDLPRVDLPRVVALFAVDSLTRIVTEACAEGPIGLLELKTENSVLDHPLLGFCPGGFSLEVKDSTGDAMNVEIVKESLTHHDGIIRNLAQLLPDVTIECETNSPEDGKTLVLAVRNDRVEYFLNHEWHTARAGDGAHEPGSVAPEATGNIGPEDPNWPKF